MQSPTERNHGSAPAVFAALAVLAACGALVAVGASLAGEHDSTARSTEVLKMMGEYVWEHREHSGPLEAEFTATGEGTWDVAFHFEFRGQGHTYSGTAEGSLENGPLEGTVRNENKRRTFTFEGTTKDGTFTGRHAERSGNDEWETGTLTLKR